MLFNMAATGHTWLLSPGNVANATRELNFKFCLILTAFNSHMWLVITMLCRADPDLTLLPPAQLSPLSLQMNFQLTPALTYLTSMTKWVPSRTRY